jgi:hypothetical protein
MVLDENEIRLYGNEFLCQLYRLAQGIVARRFNRYDTFRALGKRGIGEDGVRQATDQIVQFLWLQCDFIRTIENSEDIHLTMSGLAESERICSDNPVTRSP